MTTEIHTSEYDQEQETAAEAAAFGMRTLKIQEPAEAARILQQVQAIAGKAKDYTVPAKKLTLIAEARITDDLHDDGTPVMEYVPVLLVQTDSSPFPIRYELRKIAHEHLAEKLGIGQYYYRKLLSSRRDRNLAKLLASNVNHWFERPDENRSFLLRTIDNEIRAIVSDRFFILDNLDLALHTINVAAKSGALVQRLVLTEEKFNIRLVYPNTAIALETQADRTRKIADSNAFNGLFGNVTDAQAGAGGARGIAHDAGAAGLVQFDDPGQRHNDLGKFFETLALAPDCFIGGVDITNSEVGRGGLDIRNFMFETYCKNTAIYGKAFGRIHHGSQNTEGLLSVETKQKQQAAVWGEVEDVIRTTFDPVQFRSYVEKLLGLQQTTLSNPAGSIELMPKVVDPSFTPEEVQGLMNAFLTQGLGSSAYALVSAVTLFAQTVEKDDPERARDLELIGGKLVESFPHELVTVR